MESPRRTQHERTAITREALVQAARRLFGAEGYATVGTERVAREAGVTRGALYHQFTDKAHLFAAVLDDVEKGIAQRVAHAVLEAGTADIDELLMAGATAWLDACAESELQRIVLLDGPSVLGWERWREICLRHSVGLIASLLQDGIDRGVIADQPVAPLTHVLVGAVDEAALYVALAADPAGARADIEAVLRRLTLAITVA